MVGGRAIPEDPQLKTATERKVWKALRSQLQPGEVLLSSVRFSDARNGDVEADLIVLIPELGAAVIEVKGGEVRYEAGEWTTNNGSYQRRIQPVEQARRAKHALRRFLDRQSEWKHPLLRTEWFLALPVSEVDGDLGPEARRDLIFDRTDLNTMLEKIRTELASSLNTDHVPQSEWVETALTLLLRKVDRPLNNGQESFRSKRRIIFWSWVMGLISLNAAVAFLATLTLSTAGVIALSAFSLSATSLVWWLVTHQNISMKTLLKVPLTPLAGIILGIFLGSIALNGSSIQTTCDENYNPCVPKSEDINCSDLSNQVKVTGQDIYQLDRDGDGIACESLPSAG